MKENFKKSIAAALAVVTTLSGMPITAHAQEDDTSVDEQPVEVLPEETPEAEKNTEGASEPEKKSEDVVFVDQVTEDDQDKDAESEKEEAPEKEAVKEEAPEVIGNIYVAENAAEFAGAVSQIPDDSENRVMIATNDDLAEVLTDVEYSAVAYDGVYVVDFGSAEDKNAAIDVLSESIGKENVAEDVEFGLDDDEDHSDLITEAPEGEETEGESDAPEKKEPETTVVTESVPEEVKLPESSLKDRAIAEGKVLVAVIDTGANDETADELVNVTDALNGYDDNGHGTKIASVIKEMSGDNALILSVKAFDASGKSSSSTMYAAVKYAIEAGADIINISASAGDSEDAQLFKDAIRSAVEAGIKVVASVGNGHVNAENMIPANIDGVYGITSLKAETHEITGNYGSVVDYGVVADSTSVAAATYTGLVARGDYEDFKNDILFEINDDGTVKEEPVDVKDSEWEVDCNSYFYGDAYYWKIPYGETTTEHAVLVDGYQQETLQKKTDTANGHTVQFQKYGGSDFKAGHGYAVYANTHSENTVSDKGGTVTRKYTYYDDAGQMRQTNGTGYEFSSSKRFSIGAKTIPNLKYLGLVKSQNKTAVPASREISKLSADSSTSVRLGEEDAFYWSNVPGVNAKYWQGWDNTDSGDKYTAFRVDFYYQETVPTYNVKVTYVDYDDHSNILKDQFTAVSNIPEGETYTYNTAETVDKNGVTYYRKSVDKGDDPAVLTGVMPAEDVEYTVYYRRKYNLTINYVELNNPTNILKDPTKASYFVDEEYSHNIPKSLTKDDKVYYVNSRSDEETNLEKVSGAMPNKDIEITIYYKQGHMIETKVTHGKITRSGGKLGPDSYMGDWEIAYDGISDHETRTVSYEPEDGYVLDTIKVDGVKLSYKERLSNKDFYLFPDIVANHKIEVIYVKQPLNPRDSKMVYNDQDKAINKKLVLAGQTLTYKITVENDFSDDKEFKITDVIPAETEYVEGSASDNGSYDKDTRTVTWNINIPSQTEKVVSFKVKVLDEAKGKTEYNTATAFFDDIMLQTNTVENPVLPDPKKSVKDSDGNDINGMMVDPKDTLHYEIFVQNPSEQAEVFTVTDKMINQTAVEESINYEGSLSSDGKTITWNVKIPAKGSVTLSFDANANKYDSEIPNTAIVGVNGYEVETNPTDIWTPPVPVKSVKTINGLDIDGKAIKFNDEFYYEINVRNNSDLKKTYTVTDTLPEAVTYLEAGHKAAGNIKDGSGASVDGKTVKWVFDLEAKEERVLYVKARLEKVDVAFENKVHQTVEMSDTDSNEVTNWSGRIIINAEIEEYYEPYGQPAFVYSITDKNGSGDTWHRMIIIDTETRKGQAVYDIPTGHDPDTWIVKDEKDARYSFVKAWPETPNFTTEGNTGTGLITQTSRTGIVDYLYKITKWDETSHMDAATNTLNYKRS